MLEHPEPRCRAFANSRSNWLSERSRRGHDLPQVISRPSPYQLPPRSFSNLENRGVTSYGQNDYNGPNGHAIYDTRRRDEASDGVIVNQRRGESESSASDYISRDYGPARSDRDSPVTGYGGSRERVRDGCYQDCQRYVEAPFPFCAGLVRK